MWAAVRKTDHEELRWCIVVDVDPMSPQVKGTSTAQYCSVVSISARGEGGTTEHIFYHLTDNRPTGAHGRGTISTEDAETDLVIKNLIGSLLAHPPKTSLSQTATIEASILRRTDRVPRPSGRAESVFKRNKPDAHSSACLVYPAGAEHVRAHGSSDKDNKETIQKTDLYFLQSQIRSGFYNRLITQVFEIGDTLANLVQTVADEVMEQRDTAKLGQLNTNVRAQLAAWARGATFLPQSMTRLVPCDHLPALPASIPNYTHRILVGALAFSTSCHTATPTPVNTPIFRGILQDWVLVIDDKHTADLVPHRVTLHLVARFMEMICQFDSMRTRSSNSRLGFH